MKTVSIKKAPAIPISGAPAPKIEAGARVKSVAALPAKIPLIRPRLLVKKGDRVKIGSPLYEDKENTRLRFLSPGGGTISDIEYGHRRAIEQIIIETDKAEEYESFDPIDAPRASTLDRDGLIGELMDRGLWPLIQSLPYRNIASADESPASLWVALDSSDPFQVPSSMYLDGNEEAFVFGIRVLERLGVPVYVCESQKWPVADKTVASLVTHRVSGEYPAEDPGVLLYHTKTTIDENQAWFIKGQDVLFLAEGLLNGHFPTSRIIAVSSAVNGSGADRAASDNRYVKTRAGAPLKSLVHEPESLRNMRWVMGGLFRGHTTTPDAHMGFHETALTLVEPAFDRELFGFLKPGLFKPTVSRAFFYSLHKKNLPAKADMRGEERACINCGKCEQVCPVDIIVHLAYKSIYAGEIEDALMHGMLDCVECGLCSYVCPAKIELAESLTDTRHAYYKDRI